MFKSLPSLDLRRFVYPHTFSTNGTRKRLESLKVEISSLKVKISSLKVEISSLKVKILSLKVEISTF